jgi:hypothetical protein
MPISKQSILELKPPLIANVSSDAVDFLNGIIDRYIAALFPKGSNTTLESVAQRYRELIQKLNSVERLTDILAEKFDEKSRTISEETIKRMIRSHAGDVNVPMETNVFVHKMIGHIIYDILSLVIENEMFASDPSVIKKIEARHLISYLYETEEGKNSELHKSPIGPLEKGKKRSVSKRKSKKRSSSKSKKRSSSKRKSCSSGKISIRGFRRSGRSIKSYCRKK